MILVPQPEKKDLHSFNQINKKTNLHRSQTCTAKLYTQFEVLRSTTKKLYLKKYFTLIVLLLSWYIVLSNCPCLSWDICLALFWLTGSLITPQICSIVIRPTCSIVGRSKFYQTSSKHVEPVTWPTCSPVIWPTYSSVTRPTCPQCLGQHVHQCLGQHVPQWLGQHVHQCLGQHVNQWLGQHVH